MTDDHSTSEHEGLDDDPRPAPKLRGCMRGRDDPVRLTTNQPLFADACAKPEEEGFVRGPDGGPGTTDPSELTRGFIPHQCREA